MVMVHVSTCSRSNMFTLYPFKEEAATKNVPKPQKSSNRPIFRRLYTLGRTRAIRSLEFLKFCSFGTMLPTLWDSQKKGFGTDRTKGKIWNTHFCPISGTFRAPWGWYSLSQPPIGHISCQWGQTHPPGPFPETHHRDERVSEASDWVIFTRSKLV